MPVELLPYTPTYCLVGTYRFVTDKTLWGPLWNDCARTLKLAALVSLAYLPLAFPVTLLYVHLLARFSPLSPRDVDVPLRAFLGLSPAKFVAAGLCLGQVSAVLEWVLARKLAKAKSHAYEQTVLSRGKDAELIHAIVHAIGSDFWQPYVEEWAVPPLERAQRNADKVKFYRRIQHPLFRLLILRFLLLPIAFIPFLTLGVGAALKSLTLARDAHAPYFVSKRMSPLEVELFIVERQTEYRAFGFVAAIMERLPIVGLLFSVSNRVGAAMWAHDLEKRQHAFRAGALMPTQVYESKLAKVERPQELPPDTVGAFPGKYKDL